jgi:hypothetical protein
MQKIEESVMGHSAKAEVEINMIPPEMMNS